MVGGFWLIAYLSISQTVNKNSTQIQFSHQLEVVPQIFQGDGEKAIGKSPITVKKSVCPERQVIIKADGYLPKHLLLTNSLPLNVDIVPLNYKGDSKRIPLSELVKSTYTSIEVGLIKEPSEDTSAKSEIILLDPKIEIPASSLLGLFGSKKFQMIGKEAAFDPVFGSKIAIKAELNRFIEAFGYRVMNKRNKNFSALIAKSEPMPYVSVEPVITDFAFSINNCSTGSYEHCFSSFSLSLEYLVQNGNDKKTYTIVSNGFAQSKDPQEIFMKALFENSFYFSKNLEIKKWVNKENSTLHIRAQQRKIELVAALPMPTDFKSQIKQCMEATVTIKSEDGSFGSGFLINSKGLILTNFHVISDAEMLKVTIGKDTTSYEAKVIKYHDRRDLAIIQINKTNTPYLELEVLDKSEVGDPVTAIGTPASLKLGQSVSRGILSGKRTIDDLEFLQTDVSINPGNSGGPLIDQSGKVIGIVVKKISGDGYEGLGFAIPSQEAMKCLNLKYN